MADDKKIQKAIDSLAKQLKDHSRGNLTSEQAHKIASDVARKRDRKANQ